MHVNNSKCVNSCNIIDCHKIADESIHNTNKRKVETPDTVYIATVYWETTKLIQLEKGSSVITISEFRHINIAHGKEVDTKITPTIRISRKQPVEPNDKRSHDLQLEYLYLNGIAVPTKLKKGIV